MKTISKKLSLTALCCALLLALPASATAAPFRFDDHPEIDAMREFIIATLPLGTARDKVRDTFVENGKATIITHPGRKRTEKYLYDIDICGIYLWRWNISADFDDDEKLMQAYVNGKPVHMSGKPDPLAIGYNPDILHKLQSKKVSRAGADKFPDIFYQLLDSDGDLATTGDQSVSGPGYRAAMPYTFVEPYYYKGVFPWRSIFDEDNTTATAAHKHCNSGKHALPPILEMFMPDPSNMPKLPALPDMQPPSLGK